MITLFNLVIWVLIFIGVIFIVSILYMIVRKSKKKFIFFISPILIGIIFLLITFYSPVKLEINSSIEYDITINNFGNLYKITDEEEGKDLIDILNRQTLIRSTEKTLLTGDRRFSVESISISVTSNDEQYIFVFLRKESMEYSYVKKGDGQYYTIKNVEDFLIDILSYISDE